MDFKKLEDGFNASFIEGVGVGLRSDDGIAGIFRASCYPLLVRAVNVGQIGPDFSIPEDIAYCRILAVAGFLRECGNKMTPTYYTPTERTMQLINDLR